MTTPILAAELELEVKKYLSGLSTAQRAVVRLDGALATLVANANKAERALNRLSGKVDVTLETDLSDLARAEAEVAAIDGATPKVTLQADSGDLDKAKADIADIDGATPKVTVKADAGEVDRAEADVRALDGASPKITVQADTSAIDAAANDLKELKKLAKIDLVLTGAGLGIQAASAVKGLPFVSAIQDMQEAENLLAARAGDTSGALEAVSAVFAANYGESRVQLAELAAGLLVAGSSAETLQADMLAVLNVAASQGQDVNETFSAMDRLVSSGLVGSFGEAADVLVTGFQNGADRAGDFLDTIREYSSQFANASISAESFIGFLSSGLEAGAFNADKLADSVKEAVTVRLSDAASDPASAAGVALGKFFSPEEIIDMEAMVAAGTMSGGAYIEAVIAAINEQGGSTLDLYDIVGTQAEDLTRGIFEQASFDAIEVTPGIAQAAAASTFNTMGSDIQSLGRTIETQMIESFKVAGQGVEDWIDGAREKINLLGQELRSGTGLPEALEIALQAPGLSAKIRDFEGAIGGFMIELQLALASVAEFFGNAEAGSSLRASAAEAATGQLTYDLVFASDPVQIQTALSDAMRRGVSDAGISAAMNAAISESIGNGAVAQAENILFILSNSVRESSFWNTDIRQGAIGLTEVFSPLELDTTTAQAEINGALQTLLDDATDGITVDEAISDILTTFTGAAGDIVSEAMTVKDNLQPVTDGFTSVRNEATLTGTDVASAMDIAASATEDSMARMLAAHDATFPPALAWWEEWKQTAFDAIQASGGIIPNVQTVPPRAMGSGYDGYATGGVMPPGQAIVGERGREIISSNTALSVLNNRTTEAILSGLAGIMHGGGAGGAGNVYNVNTTINTSGFAQAAGAAGHLSRQLRGYA